MTTLLGTLGFTPEKLLGAIKTVPGVTHVTFYTSHTSRSQDKRRSTAAVRKVEGVLQHLDVPFDHVVLPDPFDFGSMLGRFLQDLKRVRSENAVFNITGGSKPMSMAAAIACMMTGVRTYYVPEEQEGVQAILLPIFQLRYSRVLTPKQRKILEAINTTGPKSESQLAHHLGILESTLSGHLSRLADIGAVTLSADIREGRIHRPELTAAGKLLLSIEDREVLKDR